MVFGFRSVLHERFYIVPWSVGLTDEHMVQVCNGCRCRDCDLVRQAVFDKLRDLKRVEPAGSC